MATRKTATKKAPARKAVRKTAARKAATRAIPEGFDKFSFNFPTKLIDKYKKRAARIKKAGEQDGDGRWGYQSLIRETLEKAAAQFRA